MVAEDLVLKHVTGQVGSLEITVELQHVSLDSAYPMGPVIRFKIEGHFYFRA